MKGFHLLLITGLLAGAATPVHGQRVVTGTVRGEPDGKPVAEAQVRLRGGLTTVQTTATGTYRIDVPAGALELLVVTHPEFDEAEIELMGRTTVDVMLRSKVRLNQYGVPVDRTPVQPEKRDGILVFESADGSYKFWFDFRVQMDGAMFMGDTYSPIGNGVEVRRARAGFKSQFGKKWYGELDLDFADSRADLKDAYLQFSPNEFLELRAGNFKEIFSLEQNTTSRYLTFLERPMVTRVLTPSRHLGFQAAYSKKFLMMAGGVHFQEVGGWEEVENRKENNQNIGANEGYSLTGKVVLMPMYADGEKGLHLGVAGSYRTPKTTDVVDAVRLSTRGISNINRRKYLDTDQMQDVSHSMHTGFDAAAYYRGFRIQGEYDLADFTYQDETLGKEKFNGFYVFGSMMLFGGRQQYNTNDAEFTQPKLGQPWGDVELAVRYEYLDLNSRKEAVMGGEGEGLTIGINYYPLNNVKVMANYGIMNHDRWANGRGRLPTGLDAQGNPTRDPRLVVTPEGEAGEDYSLLSFRIQVSF